MPENKRSVRRTDPLLLICLLSAASSAQARENIHVVGSSTVYPFATVAAEKFGKSTAFKTPIIEATGSGGGMKLFCAGVGEAHPDFTNSSRRIKKSEFKQCMKNGVTGIIEIKIGYDGIVLANSRAAPQMSLTRKDIFLALAKDVPGADDSPSLVPNPHTPPGPRSIRRCRRSKSKCSARRRLRAPGMRSWSWRWKGAAHKSRGLRR